MKTNGNKRGLIISDIQVNFGETIIVFKPIDCRGKLKKITVHNSLLVNSFPGQKNLVQVEYKEKKYSMLFTQSSIDNSVEID